MSSFPRTQRLVEWQISNQAASSDKQMLLHLTPAESDLSGHYCSAEKLKAHLKARENKVFLLHSWSIRDNFPHGASKCLFPHTELMQQKSLPLSDGHNGWSAAEEKSCWKSQLQASEHRNERMKSKVLVAPFLGLLQKPTAVTPQKINPREKLHFSPLQKSTSLRFNRAACLSPSSDKRIRHKISVTDFLLRPPPHGSTNLTPTKGHTR